MVTPNASSLPRELFEVGYGSNIYSPSPRVNVSRPMILDLGCTWENFLERSKRMLAEEFRGAKNQDSSYHWRERLSERRHQGT